VIAMAEIVVEIDIETYEMAKELAKAWGCNSVEEALIKAIKDYCKAILEKIKLEGDSHE